METPGSDKRQLSQITAAWTNGDAAGQAQFDGLTRFLATAGKDRRTLVRGAAAGLAGLALAALGVTEADAKHNRRCGRGTCPRGTRCCRRRNGRLACCR